MGYYISLQYSYTKMPCIDKAMYVLIDQFRYIKIHTWLRGLGE